MDKKHMMEERGNNYTLTIAAVRQNDLGDYTCSAVNKIGEGQAMVILTGKHSLNLSNAKSTAFLLGFPTQVLISSKTRILVFPATRKPEFSENSIFW